MIIRKGWSADKKLKMTIAKALLKKDKESKKLMLLFSSYIYRGKPNYIDIYYVFLFQINACRVYHLDKLVFLPLIYQRSG